jgi:hypothetical protein
MKHPHTIIHLHIAYILNHIQHNISKIPKYFLFLFYHYRYYMKSRSMSPISTFLGLNMTFKSISVSSKLKGCKYGNLDEVQALNNVKLNLDL